MKGAKAPFLLPGKETNRSIRFLYLHLNQLI